MHRRFFMVVNYLLIVNYFAVLSILQDLIIL
jgi:hypothetical protein